MNKNDAIFFIVFGICFCVFIVAMAVGGYYENQYRIEKLRIESQFEKATIETAS